MKETTKRKPEGAMRSGLAGIVAFLLLSACDGTMTTGAGCKGYAEQRLKMPQEELPLDAWGLWVADLDDRMTGVCRGK